MEGETAWMSTQDGSRDGRRSRSTGAASFFAQLSSSSAVAAFGSCFCFVAFQRFSAFGASRSTPPAMLLRWPFFYLFFFPPPPCSFGSHFLFKCRCSPYSGKQSRVVFPFNHFDSFSYCKNP